MARYPSSYKGRRNRIRNRIYLVSVLLIVGVAIAFIGKHLSGTKVGETPASRSDANVPVQPDPHSAEDNTEPPPIYTEPLAPEIEQEPDFSKLPAESDAESNPQAAKLIEEAVVCIDANPSRIIEARDKLNECLSMSLGRQQEQFVKQRLSELADKWLFGRGIFPLDGLCESYKVKSGDQLRTIGMGYKVPYQLLMSINNISKAKDLKQGQSIKVVKGPFHAMVYRSSFTMDLYLQNIFVRSFKVGLGKPGMETPTGLWLVELGGKLIQPVWTDPITNKTYHPHEPDYPLGSRWIGLEGVEGQAKGRTGFAIHGTKKPEEIGIAGSQGCIRLHNGDVKLVYNVLMPGFSKVRVVE